MLLYSRKVHIPFPKIIDIIAILAPLGGAFIRISNLMNSEIIGRRQICRGLLYLGTLMIYPDIHHSFMSP